MAKIEEAYVTFTCPVCGKEEPGIEFYDGETFLEIECFNCQAIVGITLSVEITSVAENYPEEYETETARKFREWDISNR